MPPRSMADLRRSCSDFWKRVQQHRIKCDKAARKELLQYQHSIIGDTLRVEYPGDAPYAVVIVDRSRRMDPSSQEKVLKFTPSMKDVKALQCCCAEKLGITGSFEVRYDSSDGPVVAIVERGALTLEESMDSHQLEECHKSFSLGWNKGSEADPHPTHNNILPQLHDPKAMKSAGFASSNVKKIVHVGPTKKDGSGASKFVYENAKGRTISRNFSPSLPRHTYHSRKEWERALQKITGKSNIGLLDKVTAKYQALLCRYLHSHGYPQRDIDLCQKSLPNHLKLSTLLLTSNKDIGVHRDPMAPCPACIFGHTTYTLENNTWSNNNKGGILFILDGLIALDYGPCDIVIMDGNIAHGVTRVQRDNVKHVPMERFSAILFCTWKRRKGMCKPGRYSGYYNN